MSEYKSKLADVKQSGRKDITALQAKLAKVREGISTTYNCTATYMYMCAWGKTFEVEIRKLRTTSNSCRGSNVYTFFTSLISPLNRVIHHNPHEVYLYCYDGKRVCMYVHMYVYV